MANERQTFHDDYQNARRRAAAWVDLEDVENPDDDTLNNLLDERFHCGTCAVNGIIEIIEPPIMRYIQWLERQAGVKSDD